jgi:hypothetical protein
VSSQGEPPAPVLGEKPNARLLMARQVGVKGDEEAALGPPLPVTERKNAGSVADHSNAGSDLGGERFPLGSLPARRR